MSTNQHPSMDVVVIRAWVEEGPTPGLRVRISEVPAPRSGVRPTRVVTSATAACDEIRDWLARVEGRGAKS